MKLARTKQIAAAAIPLLAITGFLVDLQTRQGVDDWVWYLVALVLTIFLGRRRLPLLLAGAFSVLTLAGFELSPPGVEARIAFVNCLLGIAVLWITALLIYLREEKGAELLQRAERHRDDVSKLSRAIEQSPVSVVITDKAARIEYVNPKFCEVTGYSAEELLGKNPRVLKSGEMSREHYKELWDAITSGKTWRGEFHNRKKNGELFWELSAISPVLNADGKIINYLAVKEDITERKKTQEELVWKTAFLEAQVESSPDAILVVNAEAKIILRNKRFLDLFEIPLEMRNRADDTRLLRWVAQRVRNSEQFIERVNYLYAHPDEIGRDEIVLTDGTTIDRYSASVQDKAGKYYGRIWTFRDVTKSRQAEEQIREQAALLDKASDAIWVIDAEMRISYWNKGAELIYGWTAAEAAGKRPVDLFFKGCMTPELQECIDAVTADGEWMGELQHFAKDGRTVVVYVRSKAIYDEKGRQKGVLVINSDITEKKKLEAQFLRAQRMESIGVLAGGIAHDLNNVLAPIMMSVQLLKDMVPDKDLQPLLEAMETNVHRGAGLVKQVLTFGRGLDGQRIPVPPRRVIREIGQIIQESFPKSVEFESRLAPDLWTVNGDATQLHQVLLNLSVNARDAMPDGGKLTIAASNVKLDKAACAKIPGPKPGPFVLIGVSDTGTGMSQEVQDRIFEPFFTTKSLGKGTGLGLSTTLGIVKGHCGFINCHSELGKGTTFEIYIPANPATAEENVAGKTSNVPRGHEELVLLVDDEESIRSMAAKMLERYGYRVLLAANGAEALSLYAERRREIAVAIVDTSMPVMNGADTMAALRAANPKVKIIGASGIPSESGPGLPGAVAPERFVAKPFSIDHFLRTLHEVLNGTDSLAAPSSEAAPSAIGNNA